jgi:hypothetical protein
MSLVGDQLSSPTRNRLNRELNPVYEQARNRIEAVLAQYGFVLAAESHVPAAFGSAEAEYRRRGLWLRLTWDGKDRWLWIKVAPVPGAAHPLPSAWRDLEAIVGAPAAGAYLTPGSVAEQRIATLEGALREYLAHAGKIGAYPP